MMPLALELDIYGHDVSCPCLPRINPPCQAISDTPFHGVRPNFRQHFRPASERDTLFQHVVDIVDGFPIHAELHRRLVP